MQLFKHVCICVQICTIYVHFCYICLEVELLGCISKVLPEQLYQSYFQQQSSIVYSIVEDIIFLATLKLGHIDSSIKNSWGIGSIGWNRIPSSYWHMKTDMQNELVVLASPYKRHTILAFYFQAVRLDLAGFELF